VADAVPREPADCGIVFASDLFIAGGSSSSNGLPPLQQRILETIADADDIGRSPQRAKRPCPVAVEVWSIA
jgi:hypothetical protein